jgi:hypothetical protein
MFPVHQISRQVLSDWLPELAIHTGRSEENLKQKGLSVYDFYSGILRIELMDGWLCCTNKKVGAITPTPDATILRERCEAARFG